MYYYPQPRQFWGLFYPVIKLQLEITKQNSGLINADCLEQEKNVGISDAYTSCMEPACLNPNC